MNGFLSTLFGFASASSVFVVFIALYVVQIRSLISSVVLAFAIGGVLFAISVFFDRRDAKFQMHPPTMLVPDRRSFFGFLFALYFLAALALFLGTVVYAAMQLPAGDDWVIAWQRLLFFVVVAIIGLQVHEMVVRLGHRLFAGRVYDDVLASFGKPMTATENCREDFRQVSMLDLCILLSAGAMVLAGAMDWIAPVANWWAAGRRGRGLRWLIRWGLDHPNTVNLFAVALCSVSIVLIVWRISQWHSKRQSRGIENE